MIFAKHPEPVDDVMARAYEHLDLGNPKAALKLGRELERRRYTGGFEIQALALVELDQRNKAIAVLERGTRIVPENWLLWEQLGNTYSDAGRYEEAFAAYDSALASGEADEDSVEYNRANAETRAGRWDDASARLTALVDAGRHLDPDTQELGLHIAGLHARILNHFGKHEEVLEFVERLDIGRHKGILDERVGALHGQAAEALWKLDRLEEAERRALRALHFDKTNGEALWLLGELRKERGYSRARPHRVMIRGVLPEGSEGTPVGFFTTYEVYADNPDEALEFIKELEPPEVRDTVRVQEIKSLRGGLGPKGVYWAARGYMSYTLDD